MRALLPKDITPEQLVDQGAVGDFGYATYDRDGVELIRRVKHRKTGENGTERPWRFFVTAGHYSEPPKERDRSGIEFFKDLVRRDKIVVGLAGPFKLPAIISALEAKIVNVLFTDEHSAKQIAGDSRLSSVVVPERGNRSTPVKEQPTAGRDARGAKSSR